MTAGCATAATCPELAIIPLTDDPLGGGGGPLGGGQPYPPAVLTKGPPYDETFDQFGCPQGTKAFPG